MGESYAPSGAPSTPAGGFLGGSENADPMTRGRKRSPMPGRWGPHIGVAGLVASGYRRRMTPRTVTVAEAARMTGLTQKAIRRRIDRETLRTVQVDGRVHVYTADLVTAGLPVDVRAGQEWGTPPSGDPMTPHAGDLVEHVRELTERALLLQEEAARAKALLESAEKRERDTDAALQAAQDRVIEAEAKAATAQARLDETEKRLAALEEERRAEARKAEEEAERIAAEEAQAAEQAATATPEPSPDTAQDAGRSWWKRMLGA